MLNSDGGVRGDYQPDVHSRPGTKPIVVWAYNNGTDFDIAVSEWNISGWTPIEFLASGLSDELDQQVFVEPDGSTHVVWWESGLADEVYLVSRTSGTTTWGVPVSVTTGSETGRRPSVVVDSGQTYVAYERDAVGPGMAQEIVVASRAGSDPFTIEVVASSMRTDRLDVDIHVEKGTVWLDWTHGAQDMGCVQRIPVGWSALVVEPSLGEDWLAIEDTRRMIRRAVLLP